VIDWVLRVAVLLFAVTIAFIAFDAHENTRKTPTVATIARQIVAVRGLVALAAVEQIRPFERAQLGAIEARLVALGDQRGDLSHVRGQLRAIAHAMLFGASPGGQLEGAAREFIARENGGDA
jgi:NADH:ubiquinone oxidoreductase subunit K